MKTNKTQKAGGKFDLEKMKVAKLKNMHLITGGNASPDDRTVTDSINMATRATK